MRTNILPKGRMPIENCPHCSSAAELMSAETDDGTVAFVQCRVCLARTADYKFAADAVEAWNKRVYDAKALNGVWIDKFDEDGDRVIECSECHTTFWRDNETDVYYPRFCSDCGSRNVQRKQIGQRKMRLDDQTERARREFRERASIRDSNRIDQYRQRERAEAILQHQMMEESGFVYDPETGSYHKKRN